MNKKGVEHIEMILSFVLFVGALAVAFAYFHPFSSSPVSSTLLDQIYSNVEQRASTELVSVTVMINSSQIATEHRFTLNISKEFPEPWQVRAITENGSVLNSSIINRTFGEVEFDWKRSNSPFVNLLFAQEIHATDLPKNAKQLGVNDSQPGVNTTQALNVIALVSRTVLSEKKIRALQLAYQSNAQATKHDLGVPDGVSYGFQFVSPSGTVITDVPLEKATDFRIINKRMDALLANDTLEYSELGVGIW